LLQQKEWTGLGREVRTIRLEDVNRQW